MARRKNHPDMVRAKCELAERLRLVRIELYGERGGPELSRQLGLPIRTWYNYESGVTVPAEVVLRFVELTGVQPAWLLTGEGERFRGDPGQEANPRPPDSVESLLRAALDRLEKRGRHSAESAARATPVGVPSASDLRAVPERADRQPSPGRTEARSVRMDGDAMAPVVADGAYVAFADAEEAPEELDGKLIVAWVEGRPLVRWFQHSGRYGLLRAENPAADPPTVLIDLKGPPLARRVRRVLWVNTRH